jgi:hypothetical protein
MFDAFQSGHWHFGSLKRGKSVHATFSMLNKVTHLTLFSLLSPSVSVKSILGRLAVLINEFFFA